MGCGRVIGKSYPFINKPERYVIELMIRCKLYLKKIFGSPHNCKQVFPESNFSLARTRHNNVQIMRELLQEADNSRKNCAY
jgi:hypothetical protein